MDFDYQSVLRAATPFAEQFLFGGQQSTNAGYTQDRINNNELNGSGPSNPGLAKGIYNTLHDWLFLAPANSVKPAEVKATETKGAINPMFILIAVIAVLYLIFRRR